MDNTSVFVQQLKKAYREKKRNGEKGFSYQGIADKCDVSKPTVYNWFHGIATPNDENRKTLAEIFEKSEDYFDGKDPEYLEWKRTIATIILDQYDRQDNPAPSDEIVISQIANLLGVDDEDILQHFDSWEVRIALKKTRPVKIDSSDEIEEQIARGKKLLNFNHALDRIVSSPPIWVSEHSGDIEINDQYKTYLSNAIQYAIKLYCRDMTESDFKKQMHNLVKDPIGWIHRPYE